MSFFKRVGSGSSRSGVDWRTGIEVSPQDSKKSKKPAGSISKGDSFYVFTYNKYFNLKVQGLICNKISVRGNLPSLANLSWEKFYEMYKNNFNYFWNIGNIFIAGPYILDVILALIMSKKNNEQNYGYKDVGFSSLIWSLEKDKSGNEIGVLFDLEKKIKITFNPISPFGIISGDRRIEISKIQAGLVFASIAHTDTKHLDGSEITYLEPKNK